MCVQECVQLEVEYLRNDVRGCINNVATWMADEYVEKNLVTLLDSTLIHYDPLGVVLVMGAWNYPLQLALAPIAGGGIEPDPQHCPVRQCWEMKIRGCWRGGICDIVGR